MKMGFDGASSQSIYNQRYEETDLSIAALNEESLFQTAIVPLKLVIDGKDIWVNNKPSSPHFCRPVNMQYKKETKEVTVNEEYRLREEMQHLEDFELDEELNSGTKLKAKISIKIDLTMLDGKAVNAITDTNSTQTCNVCKAKPSEMNNLSFIRKKNQLTAKHNVMTKFQLDSSKRSQIIPLQKSINNNNDDDNDDDTHPG